jgi:hypothetical protein
MSFNVLPKDGVRIVPKDGVRIVAGGAARPRLTAIRAAAFLS